MGTKKREQVSEGEQTHHQYTFLASPTMTTTENNTLAQKNEDEQKASTGIDVTMHDSKTATPPKTESFGKGGNPKEESDGVHNKLDFRTCYNENFLAINHSIKGTVTGMSGIVNSSVGALFCTFSIPISPGFRFLYLLIHLPEDPCLDNSRLHIFSSPAMMISIISITCEYRFYQLFVENTVYVSLFYNYLGLDYGFINSTIGYPRFSIDFESYNEDIRKHLIVTPLTSNLGYITPWGYDGVTNYLCVNNASYELTLPESHVVVVSFDRFDMSVVFTDLPLAGIWLYSLQAAGRTLILYRGRHAVIPLDVHHTSLLFHFKTQKFCSHCRTGFRTVFSFHLISEAPVKLDSGRFNCTSPHYPAYKRHVECNLSPECEGGEDQGAHCPYSSPKCGGWVRSGVKCYSYIDWKKPISFYGAQAECLMNNGNLAMMKTDSE
ncbi:hypothetical protein ACOMHN_040143 [Nucella lapillus]